MKNTGSKPGKKINKPQTLDFRSLILSVFGFLSVNTALYMCCKMKDGNLKE